MGFGGVTAVTELLSSVVCISCLRQSETPEMKERMQSILMSSQE